MFVVSNLHKIYQIYFHVIWKLLFIHLYVYLKIKIKINTNTFSNTSMHLTILLLLFLYPISIYSMVLVLLILPTTPLQTLHDSSLFDHNSFVNYIICILCNLIYNILIYLVLWCYS